MPDPTAPLSAPDLSELVRKRLEGASALSGLQCYGVLDLSAAKPRLRVPCAVALTLEDDPGPPLNPDLDAGVVQKVRATVGVILGVAATNDAGGSRGVASAGLRDWLAVVRAELLGWPPGDAVFPAHPAPGWPEPASWPLGGARWLPLVLRRGRLLGVGENRAWWQDEYVSEWLLRSRPPRTETGARPTEIHVSTNGAPPVPLREALGALDGAPEGGA